MDQQKTEEKDLYEAFRGIVRTGSEDDVRKFLIEHLNDFPQAEQDEIVAAFVMDALGEQQAGAQLASDFQKKGIEAFEGLAREKKDLAAKDKALEIKESL